MLVSGTAYHFVFLKAARNGWPVVSPLVRLIVRIEIAQRERFMRDNLDAIAHYLTLVESRLLQGRLQALMIHSAAPVDGPIGSGFGFRTDPFRGRAAMHAGLDFPAESGTPVRAAAGGLAP